MSSKHFSVDSDFGLDAIYRRGRSAQVEEVWAVFFYMGWLDGRHGFFHGARRVLDREMRLPRDTSCEEGSITHLRAGYAAGFSKSNRTNEMRLLYFPSGNYDYKTVTYKT
jgi:hypothetical protein